MDIELFDTEHQIVTLFPKSKKTKKSLIFSDLSVFVGQRSELSNFLEEDIELFKDKPKNTNL